MQFSVKIQCDKCPSCEKLTYSPTNEAKWCCFCGGRLEGDTVDVTVAEINDEETE